MYPYIWVRCISNH